MAQSLQSYALLSFDCYGTLVDWEGGIVQGLKALTSRLENSNSLRDDAFAVLGRYMHHEGQIQKRHPDMKYAAVLEAVYDELANELGLKDTVTEDERHAFGASIGNWQAFPDTIPALTELQKHFKLVILSNVDKESFAKTLAGPLAGIQFDAVYVAEDIGTYKPDLRNFQYLVQRSDADLQVPKDKVLHTAYALIHDLVPAHAAGLSTCWIERTPNAMGGDISEVGEQLGLNFRFKTLKDLADAAAKQFKG
ncbi:putative haloalkanoic acid dehalogenase [Thozetella sp. PMI_491]|nr:putative haloalkanoic acid dehalogenase [Thozetella sp. PMI_491]